MKRQRLPRTQREKETYAAPLADMATRAGVAEQVMTLLMRESGVDTFHVCGCREGQFPAKCREHERAAKIEAERLDKHRACPCKMLDQLCEQTATAIRVGQYELADKLRRMRASHVCPGERPKDEATAVFRFWQRAYSEEEKRLDLMYFGERKPSKWKGDPFAGMGG